MKVGGRGRLEESHNNKRKRERIKKKSVCGRGGVGGHNFGGKKTYVPALRSKPSRNSGEGIQKRGGKKRGVGNH